LQTVAYKGGKVGAYSPERRHWGRINTLCSHFKHSLGPGPYYKSKL